MEKMNRTMSDQTGYMVKALEYLLKAKEEIYNSLDSEYGDEGNTLYVKYYEASMEEAIKTVKLGIGDSMEYNMSILTANLF